MKTLVLVIAALTISCVTAFPTRAPSSNSDEPKIEGLIHQLTLREKVAMVTGNDPETHELKRLGIPALNMNDGPLGVRSGRATAFPAGIALAATFNPDLAFQMGAAIGDEAKLKGVNVMLGPCINISRTPFGGRNFESYGEDPFLTSQFVAPYVKGIQSKDVIATIKHFAVNDQETNRDSINVKVDPRTLFEIHLPAFKAGVDAGSLSVMSAYNKVNGHFASENKELLTDILKKAWGFNGFVVSDWGATHSTVASANAGLDIEMPSGKYYGAKLLAAVKSGAVQESVLDDKVRRILRAMFAIHLLGDVKRTADGALGPESAEHKSLALKIAEESVVLLKNENALPLPNSLKSVAVVGPNAARLRTGGGGSSQVWPFEQVTPLQALRKVLPSSTQINFARGAEIVGDIYPPISQKYLQNLTASYYESGDFKGKPFLVRSESKIAFPDDVSRQTYGVKWQGTLVAPATGIYKFSTFNSHNIKLRVSGRVVLNTKTSDDSPIQEKTISLREGRNYAISVESSKTDDDSPGEPLVLGWDIPDDHMLQKAIDAAKSSDAVVVFAGLGNDMETEGLDREQLALPDNQVELIQQVSKVNKNTVVVLTSGAPIVMEPWLQNVSAVLQAWYPGQEGGWALAHVLAGQANPSGKLPVSFIKRAEDSSSFGNFPGHNGEVEYREGIFVGYRYLDAKQISPQFEFGYGLSYSKFEISDLHVSSDTSNSVTPRVSVKATVKNISERAGAEVVQVYVGEDHPSVPRPVRELKGFARVELAAGESKTVEISLDKSSFSFYDVSSSAWKMNQGAYTIAVGTSSRNLPLTQKINF